MTGLHAPGPWSTVLLVLAVYRVTRLVGWDAWPPIARVRAWASAERWVPGDDAEIELPGKTPSSPVEDVRPAYRRPILAHLLHCPFCLGWWISVAAYAAWLVSPRWSLVALAPFAISGAAALLAKNLDPT